MIHKISDPISNGTELATTPSFYNRHDTCAPLNAVHWHVMMQPPITQDKDFSGMLDTLNYHYTKAMKGID